ncbi:segregation/condensation protein A [Streptomyces sp. DT24]|uniref:segregation and condensation protein A n=1 Tax=Streptomyces sp. DT24 TaxID=3416520 RepID=UPI003CEA22BD
MAPTDEPSRGLRRALGRGPGAASAPGRAEPASGAVPSTGVPGPPADAGDSGGPETVSVPEAGSVPQSSPASRSHRVPQSPPAPESVPVSRSRPAPESVPVPGTVPGDVSGDVLGGVPDRAGGADAGAGEAGGEAVEGARFTVRLVNFEGPFDLLLQLISRHKLDVTEVALSRVTDEFMAYIRAMGPDWDLDQTTEFLVVAATLLDLKAARLLPAAEVEDEADLALLEARDLLFARLLQYRAYKRIADIFSDRLEAEGRRHPRTVGLEPHHAELLPEVVISIGPEGFAKLAVKAMQPRAEPRIYIDHIHAPLVSVREQAGIMVARLRERGEMSFAALTEDATDTLTVVARFLALLELYREKAVTLDQERALDELTVRWTGGEGAEPTVTDEFDSETREDAPV